MSRPPPGAKLQRRTPAPGPGEYARSAVGRIAVLAALALALALLAGPFAGIVLFVAGLATLAAYAATHPHHA
jgi:hypothetical protein